MNLLIGFVGCLIGLLIGFVIGFIFRKVVHDETVYDKGFINGYSVGKNDFYNPTAKG